MENQLTFEKKVFPLLINAHGISHSQNYSQNYKQANKQVKQFIAHT
jgi:hypothetical protein